MNKKFASGVTGGEFFILILNKTIQSFY